MLELYMIFAQKCQNFTWKLPEKIVPEFWGARAPLHPVSYAYATEVYVNSIRGAESTVATAIGGRT